MKVFVISILFLFLFSPLTAQEICNNGIDDDGDGNIDLLDPDCGCNTIDQGIGDGFEDIIGCPIDFADLITEWSAAAPPYQVFVDESIAISLELADGRDVLLSGDITVVR